MTSGAGPEAKPLAGTEGYEFGHFSTMLPQVLDRRKMSSPVNWRPLIATGTSKKKGRCASREEAVVADSVYSCLRPVETAAPRRFICPLSSIPAADSAPMQTRAAMLRSARTRFRNPESGRVGDISDARRSHVRIILNS